MKMKKENTSLPVMNMKKRGKLFLSEDLKNQIDFLHEKCDKEWSGILLYKIEKGSIKNAEELEILAEDMFLMDIGTATSTEYDFKGEDLNKLYEYNEKADAIKMIDEPKERLRMGLIHTHHSMDSYFSGVDLDELQENTPNYDQYLSLIVNYAGKFVAKLCFIVEAANGYSVKNMDNVVFKSLTSNYLIHIDLDVKVRKDKVLPEKVINRYDEVEKANRKPVIIHYPNRHTPKTYSYPKKHKIEIVSFIILEFCTKLALGLLKEPWKVGLSVIERKKDIAKKIRNTNKEFLKMHGVDKEIYMYTIQHELKDKAIECDFISYNKDGIMEKDRYKAFITQANDELKEIGRENGLKKLPFYKRLMEILKEELKELTSSLKKEIKV